VSKYRFGYETVSSQVLPITGRCVEANQCALRVCFVPSPPNLYISDHNRQLAFTFRDQISERSYYIASFALCGFSNLGSIGIQLGGLTPLAPNQGKKLAKLVFSAMVAGNTACLMTACIAGIFYEAGEQ